jgi:hypothetical protein
MISLAPDFALSAGVCSRYRAEEKMFMCKLNLCCNFIQTSRTKRVTMGKTYTDIHWKCEPVLTKFCQRNKASDIDKEICNRETNANEQENELDKDVAKIADEVQNKDLPPTSIPTPDQVFDSGAIGFYIDTQKSMMKGKCRAPNTDESCFAIGWNLTLSNHVERLDEKQKFNIFFVDGGKIKSWKGTPVAATEANKTEAARFVTGAFGAKNPARDGKVLSIKESAESQGLSLVVIAGEPETLGLASDSKKDLKTAEGIEMKLPIEFAPQNRKFELVYIAYGVEGLEHQFASHILSTGKNKGQWESANVVLLEENSPRYLFLFPPASKASVKKK